MRIQLRRLAADDEIKAFNCEDSDLNAFLLENDSSVANARHHATELLTVTYLLEDLESNCTIAYFSLLNDKIDREISDSDVWNQLSRKIPNIKRRASHPAVKVGRLAVSTIYQNQKWGKQILTLIKQWFSKNNKTGCRYITVDALRSAEGFYATCGFKYLSQPEEDAETVLMYYDLKNFVV